MQELDSLRKVSRKRQKRIWVSLVVLRTWSYQFEVDIGVLCMDLGLDLVEWVFLVNLVRMFSKLGTLYYSPGTLY